MRQRVLFIGNSFTARNDVPALVANLATATGHTLQHSLISAGGASLRRHWNKGEAQKRITATRFDAVVLQEQSTLPVRNVRRMHENVRLFHEVISAAGARMILFLTWPRANQPETQDAIAHAYTSIAEELGAKVAPVGVAWERCLASSHPPALYDRDMSHPTLAGSYLAACVLFSTLYGANCAGVDTPVDGLTSEEMHALQSVAAETVGL